MALLGLVSVLKTLAIVTVFSVVILLGVMIYLHIRE